MVEVRINKDGIKECVVEETKPQPSPSVPPHALPPVTAHFSPSPKTQAQQGASVPSPSPTAKQSPAPMPPQASPQPPVKATPAPQKKEKNKFKFVDAIVSLIFLLALIMAFMIGRMVFGWW